MIEREKQRTDQQKKHAPEKERRAHSRKDDKRKTHQQARSDTNPEVMKDKDYIKRIEEKTEKH